MGQELYRSERRKKRRWPGLKPPNTRNKEQEKNRDFKPQMRRNEHRFSGSGHTDDVMRVVIEIPLHRQAVHALDARTQPAVVQAFTTAFTPVCEDNLRRCGKERSEDAAGALAWFMT